MNEFSLNILNVPSNLCYDFVDFDFKLLNLDTINSQKKYSYLYNKIIAKKQKLASQKIIQNNAILEKRY